VSLSLERLARNQVLFREVNERLAEVAQTEDGTNDFLCECSRPECKETIRLTPNEYEGVRSHPNLFVITPGHEVTEVDRVVGTTGVYTLVEKKPNGAKLAIETDPRERQ
jgi:hypothetical protein